MPTFGTPKGISLANTVHSEAAPRLPLPSLPVFCGALNRDLPLLDEPTGKSRRSDVTCQATKLAKRLQAIQYLDSLQNSSTHTNMYWSKMIEERDQIFQALSEVRRKLQGCAQENAKRILDEEEMLDADFEKVRKKHDSWSIELGNREAEAKSDEENRKRELEEALKKVCELEGQLHGKQKLQKDVDMFQEQIKTMKEEIDDLEDLNHTFLVKERESNDELQEARQELIKGLQDILLSGRSSIGIKRMGEIDIKPFHDACKEKFDSEEAQMEASKLCSLWQENLTNPEWQPVNVVEVDGAHKHESAQGDQRSRNTQRDTEEVIDEDDKLLKTLKTDWGSETFDVVVAAFMEINTYYPSGRYAINELWNFKDNQKATLTEGIRYILKRMKTRKRKRG